MALSRPSCKGDFTVHLMSDSLWKLFELLMASIPITVNRNVAIVTVKKTHDEVL